SFRNSDVYPLASGLGGPLTTAALQAHPRPQVELVDERDVETKRDPPFNAVLRDRGIDAWIGRKVHPVDHAEAWGQCPDALIAGKGEIPRQPQVGGKGIVTEGIKERVLALVGDAGLPVPPGYDRAGRLQRRSRKRAPEAAGERIDVGVAEALLDDLDERVPGDAE